MPSKKPNPQHEDVNSQCKGDTNAPISVALARDVLRRIRERDPQEADSNEKPWVT